ncbi:uncharacterized protein LOC105392961 [Plutella xylostella]|uniref:uncharacterized protein LOC105392961 n=1 Tax=Plutella xylostella TaxID=51655 RepID=UPI0020325A72|nr:uncharacterized protein LOC105392961 [Plutella xylostella]
MEFISFLLSYFASKNILFLTAFLCWSKEDILLLQRTASRRGLRLVVHSGPGLPRLEGDGLERVQGYALDVDCPGAERVIAQASNTRAFNQRHSWFLFEDSAYNDTKVDSILSDAAILLDADVVWFSNDVAVDLYRVNIHEPLLTMRLNVPRSVSALQQYWRRLPSAVARRKDFGGVYVKAVLVISHPESFRGWDDLSTKHIDTLPKATYPLVMLLADDMNFRYDFMQVQTFGGLVNGSFLNSAVGVVEQGRAEVAATSMIFRRDRMRQTHFVTETYDLGPAYIFRQPPQSAVANIFLLPLSRGVWIASGVVFSLIALFLAVFSRRLVKIDSSLAVITPGETFTFALGAVCQQGFHMTPHLQSIRVMMFFSFITSLFLFTSYSAKIVALLQSPSTSIQTITDLAKSPLTCGVQDTPYKKTYYLENPHPATKLLYERKLKPQGDRAFSYSVVEGVARLRTGQFAFQVEVSSGYDIISKTFTESEKCGLNYIDPFRLQTLGIPIKKHSGLKEIFSTRLRWYRDTGLMGRSARTWFATKPRCDSGAAGGFVSVGITDCLPAIQVLGIGAMLAAALLLVEISVHKLYMKYSMKNQQDM